MSSREQKPGVQELGWHICPSIGSTALKTGIGAAHVVASVVGGGVGPASLEPLDAPFVAPFVELPQPPLEATAAATSVVESVHERMRMKFSVRRFAIADGCSG